MQVNSTTPNTSVQTKFCSRCHLSKPIDQFFHLGRGNPKARPHCKECHYNARRQRPRKPLTARALYRFESRALSLRCHGPAPTGTMLREWLGLPETCALCGGDIDWKSGVIDHIQPLKCGGTSIRENLRWVCVTCNRVKGTRTDAELIEWCHRIVSFATRTESR